MELISSLVVSLMTSIEGDNESNSLLDSSNYLLNFS